MKRTRNPNTKRQQIIEATKRILRNGGYFTRFSLEKVAEEAGVSKGGLLHHFPSKEALLSGVGQDIITQFDQRVQRELDDKTSSAGRFTRAYIRAGLEADDRVSDISPVLLAFLRSVDKAAPSRFNYWQQQTEQDGLDVVLATIIRLAVDGLLYAEVIDAQAISPELRLQIIERLRALSS